MVGRLLEGSRLLVPLGALGPQALQALLGVLLVEPREWDRLAAGVDAVHQIFVGRQLRLTTQQHQRLNRVRAPGAPASRTFTSWGYQSVP